MTTDHGVVAGVSVAHDRATVEQVAAAAAADQRTAVESLLAAPAVDEAFVLQTCNRVEAYVVGDGDAAGALDDVVEPVSADAVVRMGHEESLRHLLRVAAGLESIVLGEDQILGQVRDAYEDARTAGGLGPVLEEAVTKAIHVGERARTETAVNEGTLSLASAAVRLAAAECALAGETGLVLGAGEMGRLAAESLAEEVDRVLVANRTVSRADRLAAAVDAEAEALSIEAAADALDRARVVVSATGSPETVLPAGAFDDAGETVVVDIAQPRDVPPAAADRPGVAVHDLDDLEAVTAETRERRREAAREVEAMVDEEFDHLLTRFKRKRADRAISTMYEGAERVKARELETALSKLDLDEDDRAVVESMADAIVSQLLAPPTRSLRDAAEEDDWSTIHTALQLFDPDFDGVPSGVGAGADGEAGSDEDADGGAAESGGSRPEGVDGPAEAALDDVPEDVRERMPATVLDQLSDD